MGIPEQWTGDDEVFDRVNAEGTANVVRAAREAGVRRVVHTSTIDVFHADRGDSFDETALADYPKGTAYERSKQRAERLAFSERGDMDLVVVNPGAVYGPGPSGSASFETGMFEPLVKKRLPALPPGGVGLVFSEGVGRHLLAADKGGTASATSSATPTRACASCPRRGRARGQPRPGAAPAVSRRRAGAGAASEGLSSVVKRPPLVSRGQVYFFNWNARPDSGKAQRELGWQPTPLDDGLQRTLASLSLA